MQKCTCEQYIFSMLSNANQPIEQSFISVLERLQNFPFSDVVRLHSTFYNLIIWLLKINWKYFLSMTLKFYLSNLFRSGCPSLSVLCHYDICLLNLVQSKTTRPTGLPDATNISMLFSFNLCELTWMILI